MNPIAETNIVVEGVKSRVRAAGPSDAGEAIVFVHGNLGSSDDWLDLLGRTGEFGRSVALDMPGYGRADRPPGFDYSMAGFAQHLAGALELLGIERAHLVLHDWGGPWGMAWAAEHPGRVASLTLINVGILPGYRWHKWARMWRAPVLGELLLLGATRGLFRALLNAENPRPFARAITDRMFDDLDAGGRRALLRLYRSAPDLGALTVGLSEKLSALELPVLVVWGKEDRNLPVRYAQQQRRYFARAQVYELEGCGHWPFIDDPERVASLVIPFLREQLRRAAPVAVRVKGIGR